MTIQKIDVKHDEWQYDVITDFTGGLVLTDSGETIGDRELLEANFVRLFDRRVQSDTGVALEQSASDLVGTPRLAIRFKKLDATVETLLLTNEAFYKRMGPGNYHFVSNGTSTTLTSAAGAGTTNLAVVSSSGFSTNDRMGVILSDGTQHKTTVASIPDSTHITMNAAIPTGKTASNGATVVKTIDFAGAATIQPNHVILPSHDWVVVTNGVDPPHRYDGTTIVQVPNLPSSGNTVCRALGVLYNHLLLLNTTEGGVRKPRRIRNSDTGDPANWSTGNATFRDLLDEDGEVMAFAPIGPYGAIYMTNSIYLMEYIGATNKLFNTRRTLFGDGIATPSAVVPISNDEHIFVGRDGVHIFRGPTTERISEQIDEHVFAPTGTTALSNQYTGNQLVIWHPRLMELFYAYTSNQSPDQYADSVLRYNKRYKSWTRRTTSRYRLAGLSVIELAAGTVWNSATGTWDSQTSQWPIGGGAAFPVIALCTQAGDVLLYNFASTEDYPDTKTPWEVKTKELFTPLGKIRLDFVDVSIEGSDKNQYVSVYVDTAEYGSVSLGTVYMALGAGEVVKRLPKQLVTKRLSIRVVGEYPGVRINYIGYKYIMESEV